VSGRSGFDANALRPIPVEGGEMPAAVVDPDDAADLPGVFVVPSIFVYS